MARNMAATADLRNPHHQLQLHNPFVGGLVSNPQTPATLGDYRGHRVIGKSTPVVRAPQVKREHTEEASCAEDASLERTTKRVPLPCQFSSPPTSPGSSLASPDAHHEPPLFPGPLHHLPPRMFCAKSPAPPQPQIPVDIKFRPPRKAPVGGKWTEEEDQRLREIVETYGAKNWKRLASILGNVRSDVQCLHRWNKVLRPGLSKGPWTPEEDRIVKDMVMRHGAGNIKWSVIASQLPGRIGKQCRERWFNHLDPEIKKGDWMPEEDNTLFETQRIHGNRWSEIAKLLPGRTENAVKNRWNSSARKRWLRERGLDEAPRYPGMVNAAPPQVGYVRPPALSMGIHDLHAPPVTVDTPTTGLLDHDQNGLLGAVLTDSVELLTELDGDARCDGAPSIDLRASDDIDFAKAVDLLNIEPFGAEAMPPLTKPEDHQATPPVCRPNDAFSVPFVPPFDAALKSRAADATEEPPVFNMLPVADATMTSSFDNGLQTALHGCATTPAVDAFAPPLIPVRPPQPNHAFAAPPLAAPPSARHGPLTEQLHRAATVAVERIVATSSEKEVPLTMLPYFHFLNERGRESIMNQLMAQFSKTSIAAVPPARNNRPSVPPASK